MVAEITAEQLRDRLRDGDVQVIDVRPPAAFEAGHIPGAINVPFPELADRVDEIQWGEEVVVACPVGQSSLQAARLLESYEGVDDDATIANLVGGYEAWPYDLERSEDGGEAAGGE
jgi:rhodanese-related sulfurtransferase